MSKISADNISNKNDTLEIPTETVIAGSAKAWVNFNGTGVVAILDSFNVSSITDNGVGDYTVNFTNAMPSADYCTIGSSGTNEARTVAPITPTVSNIIIDVTDFNGSPADQSTVNVAVFAN